MTARLSLQRDDPHDIQDRVVRLWVDGEPWGTIGYGRTLTRDIAPGPHVVKAHNTLFGTTFSFEAAPGEEVRLRCVNGMTGGARLMVLMLGVAYLRVRIERLPSARVGEVA
ncbi:MAG: hypothetical protein IT178_03345 [Acidobacteria bacterium]|nr:hypothetical protein [Acidobacteriota bacterium]